jgi:predicted ferric reductase
VLLTLAMLAGLVVKSRPLGARVRAAAVTDTHRFLTLLALGAIAIHGIALTLDSTVQIKLPALLVPGLSPYRPIGTAIGVLATELAAVLVVSFPLRKRIGVRLWRRLHWATYAVFAAATVHGLAAGTDTPRSWVFTLYVASVAAVVFATTWRALASPVRPTTQGGSHVPNRDRPQPV